MAAKYWCMTLNGDRASEEIQSLVGQYGGILLRFHIEGGKTRVYFAAEKAGMGAKAKTKEAPEIREIRADAVTRFK